MKALLLLILLSSMFIDAQAQWVQANGPLGGRVHAFAVSGPTLHAGIGGGVYRSTNNGTQWTVLDAPYAAFSSFAVGDTNLFAASFGYGIFRAGSDGTSWTEVNSGLPETYSVTALAVSGANLFAGTQSGVFLSSDCGTNWTAVNVGLPTYPIVSSLVVNGATLFAGVRSRGLFRSTNNGASWSAASSGLQPWEVTALSFADTNLFAVSSAAFGADTVFRSTDYGTRWTTTNLTNTGARTLAFDGAKLYAGTRHGVFLSTNGGETWTAASGGLTHKMVNALAVSGTNLFAGTEGAGVYLSTDNGTGWVPVNAGLSDIDVYDFTCGSTALFAATTNGLFLTTNSGEQWTEAGPTVRDKDIVHLARDGTNFFAASWDSIFCSTDMGGTWIPVNSDFQEFSPSWAIMGLAASGGHFYAGVTSQEYNGGSRVFVSTDSGRSWKTTLSVSYYGLSVLTVDHNMVLVGDANNRDGLGIVHVSTNNGQNWTGGLLPETIAYELAVIDTNILAGTLRGLFLSTDTGASWTEASGGIKDEYGDAYDVSALAVAGTHIFLGAGHGVFLSTNNGGNWMAVNAGLPVTEFISELVVSDRTLFAGVNGYGIWKRPLSEMMTSVHSISSELPDKFLLSQNYPNPFNPSTTIRYALPHRSLVTLTVYNTLGQQVATLVNGDIDAGYHSVQFDASGLASGVYFYRLQAGTFVQTRKLLVVK